jgi:hypothetical protein
VKSQAPPQLRFDQRRYSIRFPHRPSRAPLPRIVQRLVTDPLSRAPLPRTVQQQVSSAPIPDSHRLPRASLPRIVQQLVTDPPPRTRNIQQQVSLAPILESHRLPRAPLPRFVQQLVTNPPPRTPLPRIVQRKVSEPASLDAPLGAGTLAAEALTPLVALTLDSSDRLESGTGIFEVDRLILGRFGAGSGVLLLGISSSLMISLLLP